MYMPGAPGPNVIRICKRCGDQYHPKSTRQECCNKPIKVPCVVCGTLMDQICTFKHQSSTCSRKCARALSDQSLKQSMQEITKTCKWCGKEFHPKSARDVYCEGPHYQTCVICGKQFELHCALNKPTHTCSPECRNIYTLKDRDMDQMVAHLKETMQKKYGVDNVMQLPGMREKIKAANQAKYGVDSYTQTEEYKQRVKETCLEKYGTEHHLSSPEVMAKRRKTLQEKYGVDNIFQAEEIKTKMKQTNLERYGVEYITQNPDIIRKTKQHNVEKYGVEHPLMLPEYQEKARQTNIKKFGLIAPTQAHIRNVEEWYRFINDPRGYISEHYDSAPRTEELAILFGVDRSTIDEHLNKQNAADCVRRAKSLMEEEIIAFIKGLNPEIRIIENNHKILSGKELDIYIPDYKFAIECNPTVTHNSSIGDPWSGTKKSISYHKHKTDKCQEQGIFLMHIFGYDWTWHPEIVKSMIANILGYNTKIYARKCTIAKVSSEDARVFLETNHRQGYANSPINLGLYCDSELAALMTFGKMRSTIGIDKSDLSECWELVRFCSKLNTSVVGGASKLFKHFVQEYQPTAVRSFSDRAHTKGILYTSLGFTQIRQSGANYVWVNTSNDRAYHRVNTQKKNLKRFLKDENIDLDQSEKQIMESHGYVRVYDSGTITWEWHR